MSKQRLVPLNIYAASSPPSGSRVGDVYFNTGDSKIYVWNGSSWVVSSGGGGGGATLSPGGSLSTFTALGSGPNRRVLATAAQSDGKFLVGGGFWEYNGATVNYLVRINADGSRDTGFTTANGTGSVDAIYDIAVQSNGKILIGGDFWEFNGTSAGQIARLNADGSLDTAFVTATGSGTNNTVQTFAIQPDGKILVGGWFTSWDGTAARGVVRLNSDGSRDTGFTLSSTTGYQVNKVALQSDGKILLGGNFTAWNGTSVNRVVRLTSSGSIDTTFVSNLGTAADYLVNDIAVQPDGKILLGGAFTDWNGTTTNRIVRLNADGTKDTAFSTNIGTAADGEILRVEVQTDGRIIVAGTFTSWNGTSAGGSVVRLNANGSLDATFATGAVSSGIYDLSLSGESLLLGGDFTTFGGVSQTRLALVYADISYLALHEADTLDVHGISNTANLVYTSDSRLSDTRVPTDGSVTTAKIADGAITGAKIADGAITDADVNASAGIAQSKIANLTTDLAAKAPTASPTFTGTPAAPTAAQNTNTTQVATTAFVLGQASSTTPVMDGSAAVGTGTTFARADHVHPTDTSRAPLASPTFTGTPAAPTAAADTNTTQIATTAYVIGQGYLKSATAASTYAPLASPALTGTPTSTTAAADTNTTQVATTAFVVGQAGSATPVVNGTAAAGTSLRYARQDHVHPTDTSRAPTASPTFTGTITTPLTTAGIVKTTSGGVLSSVATISTADITDAAVTNAKLANSSITINGSAVSLGGSVTISGLPSQTGNAGKYLTTDGTNASWASISGGSVTYQSAMPTTSLSTGNLWVNSTGSSAAFDPTAYYTKTAANALYDEARAWSFFTMGV